MEEINLGIANELLLIQNVLYYETCLLSLCHFVDNKIIKKEVYKLQITHLEASKETIDASLSRIKLEAKRKMSVIKDMNKAIIREDVAPIPVNNIMVYDVGVIERKVSEVFITLQDIIETFKEDIKNL